VPKKRKSIKPLQQADTKLSKSYRNTLPSRDAILEALNETFNVVTDEKGKILFKSKLNQDKLA